MSVELFCYAIQKKIKINKQKFYCDIVNLYNLLKGFKISYKIWV